jgi:hypothetical protein
MRGSPSRRNPPRGTGNQGVMRVHGDAFDARSSEKPIGGGSQQNDKTTVASTAAKQKARKGR